jgi:putative transposase
VNAMRPDFPLTLLCHVFDISRMQDDERLKVAIKAAHVQMRGTYGPLSMWPELVEQGFDTGRGLTKPDTPLNSRCKNPLIWRLLFF